MECYQEEIFGPVLVIVNADTLDDVGFVSYLTYFWPMLLFYTPWKHQKTKGENHCFKGGIQWEHWPEMS